MKTLLFIASAHGLVILDRNDEGWQQTGGALTGQYLTSVAAAGNEILLGSRDGIYRSVDHGRRWWESNEGLSTRHVRWIAYHPDNSNFAYAGTEPANIFVSQDGGQTWQECPEVATLRDDNGWNLLP